MMICSVIVRCWPTRRTHKYHFTTSVEYSGGSRLAGDIYFGILSPTENKFFSWVKSGDKAVLMPGLTPALKGIDLRLPLTLSHQQILGADATYQITGQEKSGLYLVYTILVLADADPTDASLWFGVKMEPFVIK